MKCELCGRTLSEKELVQDKSLCTNCHNSVFEKDLDQVYREEQEHLRANDQDTHQRTDVPRIYKTSWVIRITAIILFPVVLIFFCLQPTVWAFASVDIISFPLTALISLICTAFAAASVYYFLVAFKAKIEITCPDQLTIIYPFRTVKLRTDEIKGYYVFAYRGADTLIVLVLKDQNRKPVKVRLIFQRSVELGDWIKKKFVDLEEENFQNERRVFFADASFGSTLKHREGYYDNLRSKAIILNGLGCATFALISLAFWGDVPSIKVLAVSLNLLYPWVIIIVMFMLRGMVKLGHNSMKSFYPSVLLGYLLPCAAVFMSCNDYHVILYQNFFYPFVGISFLLWLTTFMSAKNKLFSSSMAFITVACLIYGYGATMYINCRFEIFPSEVVKAVIIDRHPEEGKTSNYFVVSPWGPYAFSQEVTVSSNVYQQHINDHELALAVHKGRLHIPWYEVM